MIVDGVQPNDEQQTAMLAAKEALLLQVLTGRLMQAMGEKGPAAAIVGCQQEASTEYEVPPSQQVGPRRLRVVLEVMVGGNGDRTESGEVCVAAQVDGEGPLFVLKTDSGW